MRQMHLDAIRAFEGYSAVAKWDYKQASNGYGTRALYAGEVIDRVEAERRFAQEIQAAQALVRKFAPNLDEGTLAALTSLTFNAGTSWMRSGLGGAIRAGDLETAQAIFKQYTHAGGTSLPGLVARREAEARWFGLEAGDNRQPAGIAASASGQSGGRLGPTDKVPASAPEFPSARKDVASLAGAVAHPQSIGAGDAHATVFHALISALLDFYTRSEAARPVTQSPYSSNRTIAT